MFMLPVKVHSHCLTNNVHVSQAEDLGSNPNSSNYIFDLHPWDGRMHERIVLMCP